MSIYRDDEVAGAALVESLKQDNARLRSVADKATEDRLRFERVANAMVMECKCNAAERIGSGTLFASLSDQVRELHIQAQKSASQMQHLRITAFFTKGLLVMMLGAMWLRLLSGWGW